MRTLIIRTLLRGNLAPVLHKALPGSVTFASLYCTKIKCVSISVQSSYLTPSLYCVRGIGQERGSNITSVSGYLTLPNTF